MSIDNSSGDIKTELIDSLRRVIAQINRIKELERENSNLVNSLTNAKQENLTLQYQNGFLMILYE